MSKRFLLEIEEVQMFDNFEIFSAFFKFKELKLKYCKRAKYDSYGIEIKINKFDSPTHLWFDLETSEFDKFKDMFEGLNKAFKSKTLTNLIIKKRKSVITLSYSTDRVDFKTFDFEMFIIPKKEQSDGKR